MTGIIAHRGDTGAAPENTLAAFRAAGEAGATGIELDVHLSSDGQLVVIHDDTLERTTSGSGPVHALSARELQDLSVGGTSERIPLLHEVLALPLMPVIELKHGNGRYPGIEEALVRQLGASGRMSDAVVISGDPDPLARLRRLHRGLRTLSFRESTLVPGLDLNSQAADAVLFAPPVGGLWPDITVARAAGFTVFGTTLWVQRPWAHLAEQVQAGLDFVFTDHVAELSRFLGTVRTR